MKQKISLLSLLIVIIFFGLFLRAFKLQIIDGKKNQELAENNRIMKVKISGPRGTIFDRHGEVLAKNLPIFKTVKDGKEVVIGRDEALKLQAAGDDDNLFLGFSRNYPGREVFSHIVGYLGEVSEEEINQSISPAQNYSLGDLIGRTGIEKFYENSLRGTDGGELVEVDTNGKILRRLGKEEPLPGKDLFLAVDAGLQKIAAAEMAGKKGAVVASNPENGEILILYSSPSYDPNIFLQKSEEKLNALLEDKTDLPLLNRAISGTYPPGSVFKIVTTVAGLEDKKITKNTLINDPGVIYVGSYKYANWYFTGYGKTEGEINVVRAIKRSTDTFFYKLGEMVGIERLVFWAKKFKLDQIFGLDLEGEVPGFIPSPEWKQKVMGEPWFLGNTYHLSIGQGDLALTPLGINMMTAAVANEGKFCQPRMLKVGSDEKIEFQKIGIKQETIDIVKEGMIGVCSTGGTAYPFFDFRVPTRNQGSGEQSEPGSYFVPQVACKTGTAEYLEDGKTKTHAWFTVFTLPEENSLLEEKSLVLTVLVEGGGEGSSVAAPIAKEILKEFFK